MFVCICELRDKQRPTDRVFFWIDHNVSPTA